MISSRIVKRPDFLGIGKQINFGLAVALTKTAKQGQAASVSAIKSTFTTRGTWFNQNMRHGIKITPAKKDKLQSSIHTLATWLDAHETGGIKTGHGHRISVPQWKIRPRGSRMIITTPKKARSLLASGKAFILHTEKGDVIAMVGPNHRLFLLYGLEDRVRIKKQSTFYEPIEKVVKQNLSRNMKDAIAFAIRTAR